MIVIAPMPEDFSSDEFINLYRRPFQAVVYLDRLPPFVEKPEWRWAVTRVGSRIDVVAGQAPNRECALFCLNLSLHFFGAES